MVMILLDFDKVVHSFLSLKISGYVFNSQTVARIDDFLRNRKLRVVLGENISEPRGFERVTTRS